MSGHVCSGPKGPSRYMNHILFAPPFHNKTLQTMLKMKTYEIKNQWKIKTKLDSVKINQFAKDNN